ncbi:MAG: DUF4214 domain-containing protein [Pseudomonadota bacterium]
MPRNPGWSDADAEQFRTLIAEDDGPSRPVIIDDPDSDNPAPSGNLMAGTDVIDFVELELDRDTIYSVLALGATEPLAVSIFDDEGYLLLSTDLGDFGVAEQETDPDTGVTQFFDTVYQFRPDESGTYYVSVTFLDQSTTAPYQLAVTSQSGDTDEGGNTFPVAVDDGLITGSFEATLLDPLGNDFDADGDALSVVEIVEQPAAGVAFVVDGQLLFRSAQGFTGTDTFDVRIQDENGATDVQRIFVQVGEETGEGATTAEAQLVAYLYEAGLNRDGNIDLPGLNFWIDVREDGASFREIAGAFLRSDEFTEAFGAIDDLTDTELVEELYRNVLNREGEQGGIDFWTGQLARPEVTREDMLIAFAESAENMIGSPDTATLTEVSEGDWVFG